MKKTLVRALALALVAVTLVLCLASCAKVKGEYSGEVNLGLAKFNVTYDFTSASKVTLTTKTTGAISGNVDTNTYEGEYEIVENDDGTMEITLTFDKDVNDLLDGTKVFAIDEENGTIKIGALTYTKADK